MDEDEITQYLAATFPELQMETVEGGHFFFYGAERQFPFATLVTRDDFDRASRLRRLGVFRLNIGVSKATYQSLFGPPPPAPGASGIVNTGHDFTTLDQVLPHPVYANMFWVCVLNPGAETWRAVQPLLAEAYAMAARKQAKKAAAIPARLDPVVLGKILPILSKTARPVRCLIDRTSEPTANLFMLDTPQIVQTTAQLTAIIHLTVPREEIQNVMGPGIGEIMATLAAQGIAPAGPVFTHHLRRPSETFDFEVSVPVAAPVTAAGRVQPSEWPAMKVARTVYHGPYEGLGDAWGKFLDWVEASGHLQSEELWECYLAGPESSPDPANWRTQLNRPLLD